MSMAVLKNPAAFCKKGSFIAPTKQTAGAVSAVKGNIYDRLDIPENINSALITAEVTATLAAAKYGKLTVEILSTDDAALADADPVVLGTTLLTLTGDTGGSTETGQILCDCDLGEAKRYIGVRATPAMESATTDTITFAVSATLFGVTPLPAA